MALSLSLQKPGQETKKLSLNLNKGAKFLLELFWDTTHDLDVHALLGTNDGNGAKVSSFEQVLSTYNRKTSANPNGILVDNLNKSFSTPCGALTHSGDCRDGRATDVDESITIDGSKIPFGVNEIPIFVTIHPHQKAKFAEVAKAGIRIKDDSGKLLGEYELTREFAPFDAVQMGSLILNGNNWEFAPVGVGFDGDFNMILGNFS